MIYLLLLFHTILDMWNLRQVLHSYKRESANLWLTVQVLFGAIPSNTCSASCVLLSWSDFHSLVETNMQKQTKTSLGVTQLTLSVIIQRQGNKKFSRTKCLTSSSYSRRRFRSSHIYFGVGSDKRSYPSSSPPTVEFITFTALLNVFLLDYTAPISMSYIIINIQLGFPGSHGHILSTSVGGQV